MPNSEKSKINKLSAFIIKIFVGFYKEIVILLVLIILVTGYQLFLRPKIKEIRETWRFNQLNIKEHEDYLKGYLAELEMMERNYQGFTAQQILKLKSILPKESDFPALFVQLQDLSERNNFILHSVGFADTGLTEQENPEANIADGDQVGGPMGVKKVEISMTISGDDYSTLKKFLSDIEANIRIFDVSSIAFGEVLKGPYRINLRTYYLP